MTGKFLSLDKLFSKGSTEGAQEIIDWLVERIDTAKNLRQHMALELSCTQMLLLDDQRQPAIDLFNTVKRLATEIQDNQSLVQANNSLAKIYLNDQPEKALAIIKENKPLNQITYPWP